MPGRSANVVSINLRNCGIDIAFTKDIVELLGRFDNLEAIDFSCNVGLGTSGAASIMECMKSGVKSVNLKSTGLGLAAGTIHETCLEQSIAAGRTTQSDSMHFQQPRRISCSDSDWTRLEGALRGLAALDAIDLSDNGALGTSGVARLLECVGSGVKSVNLKGAGLGLAAGGTTWSGSMHSQQPRRASCSDSDWTRLEGALRGLAALDAINLSDNGALGTLGVARLLECVGSGVKSVNLKGAGLGLVEGALRRSQQPSKASCSDSDWTRLQGALRKLAALDAIDLSANAELGTLGVAKLLECVGSGVKSVNLKGTGLGLAAHAAGRTVPYSAICSTLDWTRLEGALRGLAALDAIDLSDNWALGTSGVARLLECVGSGVKSVNLKGAGLGLAAGITDLCGQMHSQQPSNPRSSCSDTDWARLEGALRGLLALDAIDLSDNASLLTSGVGRLVSCCAGEDMRLWVCCSFLL